MINHVTLHGRFTDVPQLRKTNSGKSVCTFTLAVVLMYLVLAWAVIGAESSSSARQRLSIRRTAAHEK